VLSKIGHELSSLRLVTIFWAHAIGNPVLILLIWLFGIPLDDVIVLEAINYILNIDSPWNVRCVELWEKWVDNEFKKECGWHLEQEEPAKDHGHWVKREHDSHHNVDVQLRTAISKEELLPPDELISSFQSTGTNAEWIVKVDGAVGRDVVFRNKVVQVDQVVEQANEQLRSPEDHGEDHSNANDAVIDKGAIVSVVANHCEGGVPEKDLANGQLTNHPERLTERVQNVVKHLHVFRASAWNFWAFVGWRIDLRKYTILSSYQLYSAQKASNHGCWQYGATVASHRI